MPINKFFLAKPIEWLKRFNQKWIWEYILFPFLTSRLVLILVAWFGHYFTANPGYGRYIQKGYFISPFFQIDMWSHWDGEWYLSIVKNGFVPSASISTIYSNLAFFPLFPDIVRLLTLPFSIKASSNSVYLATGILVSVVFFLLAAYLLYKLVMELLGDEGIAQRTILLLIAFPSAFFFSAFYPESLFLFLIVAFFTAAWHKKWFWASLLCGLAGVTRPQGLLLAIPLLWFYMESRQWKIRAIKWDMFFFLLVPLFVGIHFFYLHSITGDWLAYFHAENSWGRFSANTNGNLIQQFSAVYKYASRVDFVIFLVFVAAAVYSLFKLPSKGFGVASLSLLALPILSGSWASQSRYLLINFPVFIILAWASRKREVFMLLLVFFIAIQVMYFYGWTSYYFIA